jgi:DNA excision repair protein ERCC-3
MFFSAKRQQFLIAQGYSFKVISSLPLETEVLKYQSKREQIEMLRLTLEADEDIADVMRADQDDLAEIASQRPGTARRVAGSLTGLSGAGTGWMYMEYDK